MLTLNKIIYNLRNLRYGGLQSDDFTISDRQIAHWADVERALLIKQDLDKSRLLNKIHEQSLGCVKVICADPAECCQDIDMCSGYQFFRTEKKIPQPLQVYNPITGIPALLTFVGLPDGFTSFDLTSSASIQFLKYKKWSKKKPRAYYNDGYIYIVDGPDILEYINIKGVFEEPEEAHNYNNCDKCYTYDDPYPLALYLTSPLIQIVTQKYLSFAMTAQQQDVSNNSKDNPAVLQQNG